MRVVVTSPGLMATSGTGNQCDYLWCAPCGLDVEIDLLRLTTYHSQMHFSVSHRILLHPDPSTKGRSRTWPLTICMQCKPRSSFTRANPRTPGTWKRIGSRLYLRLGLDSRHLQPRIHLTFYIWPSTAPSNVQFPHRLSQIGSACGPAKSLLSTHIVFSQ
jgi:hypothetical protein